MNIKKDGKYTEISDILKDPTIRAIGLIGDVNTGKTNILQHIVRTIQTQGKASIYSYGLVFSVNGVQKINSVEELEKVRNSIVIIDEFPNLFSLNNRRQKELFEKSMRLVFQRDVNNVVIICGVPHNFDKFLGGLLQVLIFKQLNLVDLIQRSPCERIIASFSSTAGTKIVKGSRVLSMPKDTALIYDTLDGGYSEVTVPYLKDVDTKLDARPIIEWNKIKAK